MSLELGMFTREEWMSRGSCSGKAHEFQSSRPWFPERGDRSASAWALELCEGCPVLYQCLDFALTHNIQEGVWGGTTGRERRTMRRDNRKSWPAIMAEVEEALEGADLAV